MDPVVSNLKAKSPETYSPPADDQPAKTGASKFDGIKRKLSEGASGAASSTSPAQQAHPAAQTDQIRPNKIDSADGTANSAQDRIRHTLAVNHQHLARLRQRVDASSNTSSLQGVTKRLAGVEDEYRQLDSALRTMPRNATPQQWMALQQRVYNVSENVGTLSNIVNQATGSVKSILQTQL
jgi:hypothetical protein